MTRLSSATMTAMMMMTLVLLSRWIATEGTENLLLNPSFEEKLPGTWNTKGFDADLYPDDKLLGQYSLRCSNRKRSLSGPAQYVRGLKMGRGYELRAYVKLLNDSSDQLWQSLKAIMKFDFDVKVEGSTSDKPKRCVGLEGTKRKECLAVLKKWREEMKKQRQERKILKKQRMQEKKKNKEEKKAKEKKLKEKKKLQDKKKKEKEKQKKKEEKEKEKEKKKDNRESEKRKQRKENDRQKKKEQNERERQKAKEQKEKERQKESEKKAKERQKKKDQTQKGRGKKQRKITQRRYQSQNPSQTLSHLNPEFQSPMAQRNRRHILPLIHRRHQLHRRDRREVQAEKRMKANMQTAHEATSGEHTSTGTYIIAWRAFVTSQQGWILLTGNINSPMLPFRGADLSIRGPDEGIDFLVDNVTLYEIPENENWLADSHVMIDRHRKSNISLRVTVPRSVNENDVEIEVVLKNHSFAFGSKAEDKLLTGRKGEKFRDVFFNLFNWATVGSFKWRFDKGHSLYSPDFSNAAEALEVLLAHGIKVRAHSILWGVMKNVPDKVLETPPEELPRLLKFHTEYMVNLTRGKVEHWDVQNELLHGHWYEETMKDPHVSENIFKMARVLDPYVKLYLNDFTAVNSGANTEDFHDLALRFIKAGTGIQGLGIQGHVKEFIKPDPTMIWRRLDRLAETGLELFMTEFDLGWKDDVVRADWFEDAMRAYFAHPGLSGVILWGFWKDWQTYPDKYLVYGEDLQFAEPGERFVCLTQKEWTTRQSFNLANGTQFSLRGFHGDYEIVVKKNGTPVQRETFSLGNRSRTVDISVTESNDPISVHKKHDYVPKCISHRDQKSLGVANSSFVQSTFTCADRLSSKSGSAERDTTSVTCVEGEIMTSCSSFHPGRISDTQRGEKISFKNGVATCTAFKGPGSNEGVMASARCCRASELTCDYRQAGPSSPMDGAFAESKCPLGHTPLGCSIYNQYSVLDGAFPDDNMTSCLAQSGPSLSSDPSRRSGAMSFAACCKRPGLRCTKVTSTTQPIRSRVATVTCSSGDVMTGCNAQTDNGGSSGARIITDPASGVATCNAYFGKDPLPAGGTGGKAVAICCNTRTS